MGEQMEMEEMNQTQLLTWLINNILFCYEGNKQTGNESEKKQHFLEHKGKHCSSKEAYTNGLKRTERKLGFAVVFASITRKRALPEEATIHTAEVTTINTAMKERT